MSQLGDHYRRGKLKVAIDIMEELLKSSLCTDDENIDKDIRQALRLMRKTNDAMVAKFRAYMHSKCPSCKKKVINTDS